MTKINMLKIMMESYCKEIPYNDDGGVQLQLKLIRLLDDMVDAGMLPPGIYVPCGPYETVEYQWEDE